MPAAWQQLLRMLGVLVAISGAGAAAAQLALRLRHAPSALTVRLRDGLLASALVTALGTAALIAYYYVLR